MKTIFLVVALIILSIAGGKAQVHTYVFESKDAFKSFFALQQIDTKEMTSITNPAYQNRQDS
jgi:hypothetical protein